MRITNDDGGHADDSPYAQLLNLQTAYQSRLLDESLRYLAQVQGALAPLSPGTILIPRKGLTLMDSAEPGGSAKLSFELRNVQRVHCMVMPHLTPLVLPDGTTWFPVSEPPSCARLLAPDETAVIDVSVAVPDNAPLGTYSGALLLTGFHAGAIPVQLDVAARKRASTKRPVRKQASKGRPGARKASSKRAGAAAGSKSAGSKSAGSKSAGSKSAGSKSAPARRGAPRTRRAGR